jgi:hypothetical protein
MKGLEMELKDQISEEKEIKEGENPMGPKKIIWIPGFDPLNDNIYKYRINLNRKLLSGFSTMFNESKVLRNICSIIVPQEKKMIDHNCYYNYYIEAKLDDQDSLGMYYEEGLDIEILIAFRKLKCNN